MDMWCSHSYTFFFSVSSLMCSMITQRFRKQDSCKYLDQREGSKVKSGSELSDGAYAFPAMRRALQWMLFARSIGT
jgi:hypothetical protein